MSMLDKRLSAIMEMIPRCGRVADIGSDHGRLGARLLLDRRCDFVEFTDISVLSLQKARALIERLALCDRAIFSVGDGARALTERADAAVIAGMGGQTIAKIIRDGREVLNGARLILQPNVASALVRECLCDNGYAIVDEVLVRASGWWYVIICAEPGVSRYNDGELLVGPVLLRNGHPLLGEYAAYRARIAAKAYLGAAAGNSGNAAALKAEREIWEGLMK